MGIDDLAGENHSGVFEEIGKYLSVKKREDKAGTPLFETIESLLKERVELPLLEAFVRWREPNLKNHYNFEGLPRAQARYLRITTLIDEYILMSYMAGLVPVRSGVSIDDPSKLPMLSLYRVGVKSPKKARKKADTHPVLYRLVFRIYGRHTTHSGPRYGELINQLQEFPPLAEKLPQNPYDYVTQRKRPMS